MEYLFKPHFYWGPTEKNRRIERKEFSPDTAIRSQKNLVTIEAGYGYNFSSVLVACEKHVVESHAQDEDALVEDQFFDKIGIFKRSPHVTVPHYDLRTLH